MPVTAFCIPYIFKIIENNEKIIIACSPSSIQLKVFNIKGDILKEFKLPIIYIYNALLIEEMNFVVINSLSDGIIIFVDF